MIKVDPDPRPRVRVAQEVHRIQTPSLALEFQWTGDRWAHAIALGPEGARQRVAESFEADPLVDDPLRVASPVFQQIHFQEDPQGVYALLFGQAGRHHFSAAMRVTEEPGKVSVEIDVADRAGGQDALLACTYFVNLPNSSVVEAGPGSVVWDLGAAEANPGRLAMTPRGISGQVTELALAESSHRGAQMQALAAIVSEAPTQRCRYCWKWVSPAARSG